LASFTRRIATLPQPSFDAVALPYLDAAYNLAYWLMRDRVEAEDVVQDALVRAIRYFSSYHGGDPRAWLLSIVRNSAYSRLAAHRPTVPLDDEDSDTTLAEVLRDPGDDPETALARREDRERLDTLLDALPLELRECVVLCDLEEMSYKEIAQVVGIPVGTVMSRLWRGRKTLTKLVKEGK
jgi:RNA polymerase sigma-70 factor, ECF subfamily